MKRLGGALLVVVFLGVFVASRTEWGRVQIGRTALRLLGRGAPPAAEVPTRLGRERGVPPATGGRFPVLILVDRQAPTPTAAARKLVDRSGIVRAHAEYLSGLFVLPRDIPVLVKPCGQVNAYWDPKARNITLCDELIVVVGELFRDAPDQASFERAVMFATSFFLFHEAGHALVHELDLAPLGKEEAIADQLAALLLLGNDQADTVLAGALVFSRLPALRAPGAPRAFWDEHGLDEQRFYDLLCWIYGSDPARFSGFVEGGPLPAERAARCPAEYQSAVHSFHRHLDPHLRSRT